MYVDEVLNVWQLLTLFSKYQSSHSLTWLYHFSKCESSKTIWLLVFNLQTLSMPNMLSSRLVLNLHTFSGPEETSTFIEGHQYSGLQFATNSFLGNIGAPLDGRINEEEEE